MSPRPYDCDENSPRPQDVWDQQQEDLAFEDELRVGKAQRDELLSALEESVKLQSHYASILNMHDGGHRLVFYDAKAWLDRLAELKEQTLASNRPHDTVADTEEPKP